MNRMFIVWLGLCAAFPIHAEQTGLQPSHYYKETTVAQPAMAPDGSLVAFTVTTINEDENKRHREIWVQPLDDGKPEGDPIRFSAPTEDSSSPTWAPDSRVLSFQSKRGDDENSTWFIRVVAPGGEAYHIEGVEGVPDWSPNGEWIAFVKEPEEGEVDGSEEPPEEQGEEEEEAEESESPKDGEREGWISPDTVTSTLNKERFDGRVITSMRYKSDGTPNLLPHPSVEDKRQLYVVNAGGGEAAKITDLAFNVREVEWLRTNGALIISGDVLEDDEYNQEPTNDLFMIPRQGGEPTKLTANPGSEWAPAVSPAGTRLAYLSRPERGSQTDVLVVKIDDQGNFESEPLNLTEAWDLSPGAPEWSTDGESILFEAWTGGNGHLFKVSADGGEVVQVTRGDRRLDGFSFTKDGAYMAYTVTTPMMPRELAVARANGSREVRATHFNRDWLAEIDMVEPEHLTWTVGDGTEIEGWVMKPVGYEPGKSYPMILKIHGGPHSAYGNTWFRTFHVLSAAGFFVLYTNPRGSAGYGYDFMYATRGKWGELDREDYLTGVDAALSAYSDIDPNRIGVSGGSYGGFMTAWLSATTDRFAAANPSRMISNWESWYGASDAQALTDYEFFGPPWEEEDLYRRLSPLNYVENVTAPTLIIHSEQDYRTPIADAEQWYIALKKQKVPVEMVRYPRSSHGLSRTGEPWLLVDRLERIRSWFIHWLIDKPEEVESADNQSRD